MTSRQASVSPGGRDADGLSEALLHEPVEDVGDTAGAQHLVDRHRARPIAGRLASWLWSWNSATQSCCRRLGLCVQAAFDGAAPRRGASRSIRTLVEI